MDQTNEFDRWNEIKKDTHTRKDSPYFKEGEIWWVRTGYNIGHESNGKGKEYARPMLVITKYNKHSFLGAALTTSFKNLNKYKLHLGVIAGKKALLNASQIKNCDSKRLLCRLTILRPEIFFEIKRKTCESNFSRSFPIFPPFAGRAGPKA